jgi:hypothetical protein
LWISGCYIDAEPELPKLLPLSAILPLVEV